MDIAEKIMARYGNDGLTWRDEGDVPVWAACEQANGKRTEYRVGRSREVDVRFDFEDGSNLVLSAGGWGPGYNHCDCPCWADQPHWCGKEGEGK